MPTMESTAGGTEHEHVQQMEAWQRGVGLTGPDDDVLQDGPLHCVHEVRLRRGECQKQEVSAKLGHTLVGRYLQQQN